MTSVVAPNTVLRDGEFAIHVDSVLGHTLYIGDGQNTVSESKTIRLSDSCFSAQMAVL